MELKPFLYVPAAKVDEFVAAHTGASVQSTDAYYNQIAFLGDTGKIAVKAKIYGDVWKDASIIGVLPEDCATVVAYVQKMVGTQKQGEQAATGVYAYIDTAIANLIGAAPETLDTLEEIAAWIADDKSGSSAIIADVRSLQEAVGAQKTETTEATGLYKYVDDSTKGVTDAIGTKKTETAAATGIYKYIDDEIEVVDGKIDDVDDKIGTAKDGETAATGLYKYIDDADAANKTLIDANTTAIGTKAVPASEGAPAVEATGLYKYVDDSIKDVTIDVDDMWEDYTGE